MKKIQVLGPGCPKCKQLAEATEAVTKALGTPCEITKVTDFKEIMAFGVMSTPALVVDGEVKVVGRVPSEDEIRKFLE